MTKLPGLGEVLFGLKRGEISTAMIIGWREATHLNVIFFQEVNDSDVVFKSHLVRHREDIQIRHIASIRLDCFEDVLRQTNRIQLEIRLEQQIDDVVNAPFSRVFKWCSENN